jgi:RNA polymerase sigma-70 factor (ECF subfamily)
MDLRRATKDGPSTRHVTYCLVPEELAAELHELLRREFRRDRDIEVVVERRAADRRAAADRRGLSAPDDTGERRAIRSAAGRRAGERRARSVSVDPPRPLPPAAATYGDRLQFVERVEPLGEYLEDQDSNRLVARAQGGDHEAFGLLYRRYFDRVYGYLQVALAAPAQAEEATQETFAAALDGLPDYAASDAWPFRAWLFEHATLIAARRLAEASGIGALDAARLARRRAANAADDPHQGAMDKLGDRELLAVLETLPSDQRQVVMLRYMVCLTNREIAAVMHVAPHEVSAVHYQALGVLSGALQSRWRKRHARVQTMRDLHGFGSRV